MAAPHVAGIAALLKSYDSTLSSDAIEDLLIQSGSNRLSESTSMHLADSLVVERESQSMGIQATDYITGLSISDMADSDLSRPLIGRLNYDIFSQEAVKSSLKNSGLEIDQADIIIGSDSNIAFATIGERNFGTTASVGRREILEEALESGLFKYFEYDTIVSIPSFTAGEYDASAAAKGDSVNIAGLDLVSLDGGLI
jgi:hypothetical protein